MYRVWKIRPRRISPSGSGSGSSLIWRICPPCASMRRRTAGRNTMDAETSALVLLSGGQDSATCLAWALDRFEKIETIGFDYRQRHRTELDARGPFRAGLERDFPPRAG